MYNNPILARMQFTKRVAQAWLADSLPWWDEAEGHHDTLLVVRYTDGTGQAFIADGGPYDGGTLYIEDVPFENEPSGHLDLAYVTTRQLCTR